MTRDGAVCCAFHPSADRLLMAAGDKGGNAALWDIDHQPETEGELWLLSKACSVPYYPTMKRLSTHLKEQARGRIA